jgi:hypothetical protein
MHAESLEEGEKWAKSLSQALAALSSSDVSSSLIIEGSEFPPASSPDTRNAPQQAQPSPHVRSLRPLPNLPASSSTSSLARGATITNYDSDRSIRTSLQNSHSFAPKGTGKTFISATRPLPSIQPPSASDRRHVGSADDTAIGSCSSPACQSRSVVPAQPQFT